MVEAAIVFAFVFAVLIFFKLRDIERGNRALVRGRAAEIQYAWSLRDLYAVEETARATDGTDSNRHRAIVHEIRKTHALIADAYDLNERTRNIDDFFASEEERKETAIVHPVAV